MVRKSRTFNSRSSEEFTVAYHEVQVSSEMESTLHNLDAESHSF